MSLADVEPNSTVAVSLAQRMRAERDGKEDATTEDFPLPGWGSTTWIRLKVIGHQMQKAIVQKNRRVRPELMDLYVAADTLIAATDCFLEVKGDDRLDEVPDATWINLAHGVYDIGAEVTPRQALLRLIGDERVIPFYGEYVAWLNGERQRIGQEQGADFRVTP